MNEERTIPQLIEDLAEAGKTLTAKRVELNEALKRVAEEQQSAVNRLADAENVYNGITRRIDASMAKLRAGAPEGTAWKAGAA